MGIPTRSNIAAIIPLSEIQEALLLHHLREVKDEGAILVEFKINGSLQLSHFKKAWDILIRQYDALRTTIHWEKLTNPVQVVHQELSANWEEEDLSDLYQEEKEQQLEGLRNRIKLARIDLRKNPLLNFHLIKTGPGSYHFLWPCHHILLDGWSTSIIIAELMRVYDEICRHGEPYTLRPVPSLRAFQSWMNDKDVKASETFWKSYLEDLGPYPLFTSGMSNDERTEEIRKHIILDKEQTKRLSAYASDLRISLNSLIQSLWGLLVMAYGNTDDVVVGATVSGRSNDFPKIDELPGMFTRVQPIRFKVTPECMVSDWLKANQKNLLGVLEHEQTAQNDIDAFCEWQLPSPLFDSIVIFENHPWSDVQGDTLSFDDFKGGLTSTYPVSIIVLPGTQLRFNFIFKKGLLPEASMDWILTSWKKLIRDLLEPDTALVEMLVSQLAKDPAPVDVPSQSAVRNSEKILPPGNEMETRLHAIWQRILSEREISVDSNFFHIGGSSLMAIRMFAIIEKDLGIKESPTQLLLHPTIRELARKLDTGEEVWEYLVPLREKGQKTPVFCVHGGEGHVLFYQALPRYLDPERPVYLVQPKGIDGEGPMHTSIAEMTTDYLKEIRSVQSQGPYNIVFFCYSALAVEFANILDKQGQQVNLIITDSTAKEHQIAERQDYKSRAAAYLRRLKRYPMLTLRSSLIYRYRKMVEPLVLQLTGSEEQTRLRKVRDQLHRNHAAYTWKRFNSPCTLILLQNEHPHLRDKKIELWTYWSQNEVDVHFTSGNHLSIFEEPHVQSLGPIIESACS